MEKIVRGIFQGTAQGFGFVRISEDEELFIPPNNVHGALPRDTVECRITEEARKDRKAAAEVIRILEHGLSRIPGNLEYGGWIVPVIRRSVSLEGGSSGGRRGAPCHCWT